MSLQLEAGNTYQIELFRYDSYENESYYFGISYNNSSLGSSFVDSQIMSAGTEYYLYMTSGDVYHFAFTPEHSDYYAVFSNGDIDVEVTVYDQSYNVIGYDDDNGGARNFYYSTYLYEGSTYYFAVGLLGSSGSTYITVSK